MPSPPETAALRRRFFQGPQWLAAGLLTVATFAAPWWLAGLGPGTPSLTTRVAAPDRPPAAFVLSTPVATPSAQPRPPEDGALSGAGPAQGSAPPAEGPQAEPEAPKAVAVPPSPAPAPLASPLARPATASAAQRHLLGPFARTAERRQRRRRPAHRPHRPHRPAGAMDTPPQGRASPCLERDHPQIASAGTDRYRIDRDLVDHYTGNLRAASRLAHVAWHRSADGRVDGFRVRRIRCGGVLHEAGLRNGDVVHTVNGRPVRTLPQALGAYRRLRKKRVLWLEVTRRGDTRTLRYILT